MKNDILKLFNIKETEIINLPVNYSFLEVRGFNVSDNLYINTPSKFYQARSINIIPFYKPISKFI